MCVVWKVAVEKCRVLLTASCHGVLQQVLGTEWEAPSRSE